MRPSHQIPNPLAGGWISISRKVHLIVANVKAKYDTRKGVVKAQVCIGFELKSMWINLVMEDKLQKSAICLPRQPMIQLLHSLFIKNVFLILHYVTIARSKKKKSVVQDEKNRLIP